MKKYEEMTAIIDEITEKFQDELIAYSDDLADHPEIGMEEVRACANIKQIMEGHGWKFESPFGGFDTAFLATFGEGGRSHKVAIMTEYDALPGLGHACGHCVSGAISILAALSLADLQDELDTDIHLMGTPAEENMGAKVAYVAQGIFDSYDAAVMIHMDDKNVVAPRLRALSGGMMTFHGKSAHASAAPWDGVNALNAARLYMDGIDMMRQHITTDCQFHSVINEGGTVPGIVPDTAVVSTYWRAERAATLEQLEQIARNCAEGAALMTGCTVDIVTDEGAYFDVKPNPSGFAVFEDVFAELGQETVPAQPWASSDVGNVSYACPAFQPTLKLTPPGTPLHTPEVAAAVKTDLGHEDIKIGARIIARWIAKTFSDPDKIAAMKKDFDEIK